MEFGCRTREQQARGRGGPFPANHASLATACLPGSRPENGTENGGAVSSDGGQDQGHLPTSSIRKECVSAFTLMYLRLFSDFP